MARLPSARLNGMRQRLKAASCREVTGLKVAKAECKASTKKGKPKPPSTKVTIVDDRATYFKTMGTRRADMTFRCSMCSPTKTFFYSAMAMHVKSSHGCKSLRMCTRDKAEAITRKRLQDLARRHGCPMTLGKCSFQSCSKMVAAKAGEPNRRCPAHKMRTAEDADRTPGFESLPRGVKMSRTDLFSHAVTLDDGTVMSIPGRGIAAVRRFIDGDCMTYYEGSFEEAVAAKPGPITLLVTGQQGDLIKYNGRGLVGNPHPRGDQGIAQIANMASNGRKANAEFKWKPWRNPVTGIFEPRAYLVAIGNAFENASESNPVEILVHYGDGRIKSCPLKYNPYYNAGKWDKENETFWINNPRLQQKQKRLTS